jgi:hypothetical protein
MLQIHCALRSACVLAVLASLTACQPMNPAQLAAGGNFPEAYECRRLVIATLDGDSGEWIAGQLEGGLSRLGPYRLVDRRKISEALDELEFQRSALIDQSTAGRVGKMVGADCILTLNVELERGNQESYNARACEVMGVKVVMPLGKLCPGKMEDVSCTRTQADALLGPRLVRVELGTVAYAQTVTGTATDSKCRDGLTCR